jgi:hypothetical protein
VRGGGFLAALMLPRGVEEKVMFAVAADVEDERTAGRLGERSEGVAFEGLEGSAGDDGEGESKGEGESNSPSGVVTGEAMAEEGSACEPARVRVLWPQVLRGRGVGEARQRGSSDSVGMDEGQMQVCSSPRSGAGDDRSRSRDGGEVVVGSGGASLDLVGWSDVAARVRGNKLKLARGMISQ